MNERDDLIVSCSPHVRAPYNTQSIMLWVVISLLPTLAVGMYMFGARSLHVILASVICCVFFEWAYEKLMKKTITIKDCSAVVTGMLLGLSLTPTIPLWMVAIGAFFAIVVVKQLYGGIGKNFLNPALAARCFMFSWAASMSNNVEPLSYKGNWYSFTLDAVTSPTPLKYMSQGQLPEESLWECFIGLRPGAIGEVSVAALLIGVIILLVKKIINLRTPLSFVLTVAVLCFLFPQGNDRVTWMLYSLCTGGLAIGAFFMANDYTTSPVTPTGQIIYGIGCGLLTVFIRYFGSYNEGVSFAILIMNLISLTIDKIALPTPFGVTKGKEKK